MTVGPGRGAAGTEILPLVFKNTGSTRAPCRGIRGCRRSSPTGSSSDSRRTAPPRRPLDALEPGQTTQAIFTYGDPLSDCPNPTIALGLRVYPPDQTAALFVPTTGVGQCPDAASSFGIYPIGASFGA